MVLWACVGALLAVVALVLGSDVQAQLLGPECEPYLPANSTKEYSKIDLVSDMYAPDVWGSKLVGEVTNVGNGSAMPVIVTAYFYDKNHDIVGMMGSLTQPEGMQPGNRSAFQFDIPDNSLIEKQTATYELEVEWQEVATCLALNHRFVP